MTTDSCSIYIYIQAKKNPESFEIGKNTSDTNTCHLIFLFIYNLYLFTFVLVWKGIFTNVYNVSNHFVTGFNVMKLNEY